MRNPILLSMLSAIMLAAGWLGASGIVLPIALLPLLLLGERYGTSARDFWKMFGWVALSFGLWSGTTTWWIWYAAPIGAILSVIITIVLFGGVFMLYYYFSKRTRSIIAYTILICGWIAAEYLYTTGEVSFPWLTLGNGLANDTWAIQWYEWTGVFGGSLWILLCNVLLFHALKQRSIVSATVSAAVLLMPLIISLGMFYGRDYHNATIRATIIQPNIDPYLEKFSIDQKEQNKRFFDLMDEAPSDVNLIVMPETAIDDCLWEDNLEQSQSFIAFRDYMHQRYPAASLITGATTMKLYPDEQSASKSARSNRYGQWWDVYNTALQIDSTGVEIHHKSKLVVGVEKMPYMNVLGFLEKIIINLGGTTGGLGTDRFRHVFSIDVPQRTGAVRVAAPICYESVYSGYFAEFVRGGAELIAVITNDGWWHDTAGYKQHFSYSRIRAIETRRAIVRSANTGISGFISPRGDVGQTLGWDVAGTLTDDVPLSNRITFFVRHGDYVARMACYIFYCAAALAILLGLRRRFKRKTNFR